MNMYFQAQFLNKGMYIYIYVKEEITTEINFFINQNVK